jgi:hypothetical protein
VGRAANAAAEAVKSDLRNHQAIVQPRLYADSLMVTQITLKTEGPHKTLTVASLSTVFFLMVFSSRPTWVGATYRGVALGSALGLPCAGHSHLAPCSCQYTTSTPPGFTTEIQSDSDKVSVRNFSVVRLKLKPNEHDKSQSVGFQTTDYWTVLECRV